MDNFEAAKKRLHELIAEAGLDLGSDETQLEKLEAALPHVDAWLRGGAKTPLQLVQAIQILMLDPQVPGVHQAAEVQAIAETVRQEWKRAGHSDSLNGLQILLLAAWPDAQAGHKSGLPQLMRSGWSASPTSPSLRPQLDKLFHEVPEFRVPAKAQRQARPAGPKGTSTDGLGFLKTNKAVLHTPQVQFGPHLVQHLELETERLNQLIASMEVPKKGAAQPAGPTDVLWWGQSAYSRRLNKSYRRLDLKTRLTAVATEASDFIAHVPFTPLAAYAGEVLNTLGDPWDERRPLTAWLGELAETREHLPALAALPSYTGLPVLALANGTALDALGEATRLDLATEIDRADWITWVLGEVILGSKVLSP